MGESPPKLFAASCYNGPSSYLPFALSSSVLELQQILDMPVILLIQNDDSPFGSISDELWEAIYLMKDHLAKNQPVALLVDSLGGYAKCAYQIADFLRKHCGSYKVVIPRRAKSAATLLSLGADEIIMGDCAELGPLDAQFIDREREEYSSALNEVQSLERLHAFSLEALDKTTIFLLQNSGKKLETVLPMAMHFVSELVRPLFEKVDAVRYTERSRVLKVAEEYATRLLRSKYSIDESRDIARKLVEKYPEHGFMIDRDEAMSLGLSTETFPADKYGIMDVILKNIGRITALGYLKEVQDVGK